MSKLSKEASMEAGGKAVPCCGKCGGPLPEHDWNQFHSCPYQADINDNGDPEYCSCCPDCWSQCNDDI